MLNVGGCKFKVLVDIETTCTCPRGHARVSGVL